MDAIELLLTRSSNNKLVEPAPSGDDLDVILKAAARSPDHANLSPYEFIVCQGEGLNRLASIFKQSAIKADKTEQEITKAANAPLRAPMVIIGICRYQSHDKVPRVEQIATTACAIQNMQMAAFVQGFGGIWRTGGFAHDDFIKSELGLKEHDEIVGYLYLGTPKTETLIKREKDISDQVKHWN